MLRSESLLQRLGEIGKSLERKGELFYYWELVPLGSRQTGWMNIRI